MREVTSESNSVCKRLSKTVNRVALITISERVLWS
jgi:hypothetical protein